MNTENDHLTENGVEIKQEHAYASQGEIMRIDSSGNDPLNVIPHDLGIVKTEADYEMIDNVDIKVEDDQDQADDLLMVSTIPTNDSSISNHMHHDTNFTASNMSFNAVSKSTFDELDAKYKAMLNQYMMTKHQNKLFYCENKNLRDEIATLKKYNKNKLPHASVRQFQRDLRDVRILENNLKSELNSLTRQNSILKKRLLRCQKVLASQDNMESSVTNLKKKVEIIFENERKKRKEQKHLLELKEREMKIMENRLLQTIAKIEQVKQKISENNKIKQMYDECVKKKDELYKELTDFMKVRYLYEDHADLIKREMNVKLKEKETEIETFKKEIEKLTQTCVQHNNTVKSVKQKFHAQIRKLDAKIQDSMKQIAQEKQKSGALREKILEKHNENLKLKEENKELKLKLEKEKPELEEQIIRKQRENVTLQEEIAMLKVHLEKIGPKARPC